MSAPRSARLAFCAAIAACTAAAAHAQLVAPPPDLAAGDRWRFAVAKRVGSSITGSGSRLILAIEPDATMRVRMGGAEGRVQRYDAHWNELCEDGTPKTRDFKFPMQVGDRWDSFRGSARTGSFEVKAEESVTVPAGTYTCLRVEGEISGFRNFLRVAYWYCPDVNYIAKRTIERRIPGREGPGTFDVDEQTLVDYRRGVAIP